MVKIIYIEHDGTEHPVDVDVSTSIMEGEQYLIQYQVLMLIVEEVVLAQHVWFLLAMSGKIKCLP